MQFILNLTRFWCCVASSRKTLLCSWACVPTVSFLVFNKSSFGPPPPKIEAHGLPFTLLPPLQVIYYMQVKEIQVFGGRQGLEDFLKKKKKKEIYMQLINSWGSSEVTFINQLPFTSLRYQWTGWGWTSLHIIISPLICEGLHPGSLPYPKGTIESSIISHQVVY